MKNRKYTETKKNGGIIPAINDRRTLYVPIACGKCMECMKKKSREWQVRVNEEIRHDKTGKFITITFNEESLKKLKKETKEKLTKLEYKERINKIEENEIATIAIRKFLERWRKKYKKSVKHWLITELGHNGTERIHMHGIIWTTETIETIEKIWKYGRIWVGEYVNEKTINYIIKYVNKADNDHKGYIPKILTSSGIGKGYMEREDWKNNKYKEETDERYKYKNGTIGSLPIYYRNKIYNEEEREKLWIEKLDKQIRYVGGEKIDISTKEGEKDYENILKWYQIKNKKLGYGDDSKEWSKEEYKKEREKMNGLAEE